MNSKLSLLQPSPLVAALIPFVDANDGVALWGYQATRAAACQTMAHFCNLREIQKVDWRLVIVSGNFRQTQRNLGEVISYSTFDREHYGGTLRGRHGFVVGVHADWVRLQGHMSDNLMWLVDELRDIECWDALMSSVVPGVKVIGINPPTEMLDFLKSFLPEEHKA